MSIRVIDLSFPSTDGIHTLFGKGYVPEGEIRGLFHVVHGMREHIGRYDSFMREIAEAGYLCFGYDNLGHGRTAEADGSFGYIADHEGWMKLARDVHRAGQTMKMEYPERPYYLMGHSMGSFIVRLCTLRHPSFPSKLIVMGTGGPNPASGAGLPAVRTIRVFKKRKGYSPLIDKLAFGKYNEKFGDGVPGDWLSKDPEVRRSFDADPYCAHSFTIGAMGDLIRLQSEVNKPEWFEKMPVDLPILLISGADDPVGDYGHGVKKVYDRLKARGADVKFKLYSDCRHELLNEDCRDTVISDILKFIAK